MPDKVRRTLALAAGRKDDLEKIKLQVGLKTDTAAINDAVEFRARLASRGLTEIQQALGVYDELKRQSIAGNSVFIENETEQEPRSRTKIFFAALG